MPYMPSAYLIRSPGVPRSITRMAREHRFGRRRAVYRDQFEVSSVIIVALMMLPTGGLLLYLSLGMLAEFYQGIETDISIAIVGYFFLVLGALSFFAMGLVIYRAYESVVYGWCVYIYDQGCIIQKSKEAAQPFSWNEIEAIWLAFTHRRRDRALMSENCTIQREDGYRVTLTRHGGNLNKVTDVINMHLCERLLPLLLAQYGAGQQVIFSPCGINQEGFILGEGGDKWLSWSHFSHLEIKETFLLIYEQERELPWASLPTVAIPNLLVLVALVDRVRDNSASKPSDQVGGGKD